MISLPAGLCYKEDSYSYRYEPSVVNTVFATGWTRNRGVEESKRFIYTFTISATQLKVQEFESFYYYDLRSGELEFEAPYWNGSYNSVVGTFRILGGHNVKEVSEDLLEISYEAEMMTRDMTVEDALYADFISSGLTWAEFGKYPEIPPTINIRINTEDFDEPSPSNCYIHGYDAGGNEADVDGTIIWEGNVIVVERDQYAFGLNRYSIVTRKENPNGLIVFDTLKNDPFVSDAAGSGSVASCRWNSGAGTWEYDPNSAASNFFVPFTRTSGMCVIGTIETGTNIINSAEILQKGINMSNYEV